DVILIAGDIFDARDPSSDVFARAMEIFVEMKRYESKAKIIECCKKLPKTATIGIPIIAIHGTHERRARGLINPVETMEKAGLLIHLHCSGVGVEKDGERIFIQGLSGVPEQYTLAALKKCDFRPKQGYFNIFLFHQSLKEFVYDPRGIEINQLPGGFDVYVCGHVHESAVKKLEKGVLLIPGSTIPTQILKNNPTFGFWMFDVIDNNIANLHFVELENQRKVYVISATSPSEVIKKIDEILAGMHDKKPIIRVDANLSQHEIDMIKSKYEGKALMILKGLERKIEVGRISIDEQIMSVEELGRIILRENMEKRGLDAKVFEEVFELLENGKIEDAIKFLKQT
ncbi:MAG TPA: hypothetical protein ENG42_02670, partial [Candidatus Aenigmarchaeota archaeon]|nr:hypothetical protein [Candidatus Aenigmarchaeota archaeon]